MPWIKTTVPAPELRGTRGHPMHPAAFGYPEPTKEIDVLVDDEGNEVGPEFPAEPGPLTEADYSTAIQAHLDAIARQRQYDSMLTAVSYISDPDEENYNPQYDAEGRALKAWRTAVWTYATAQLALVLAGERTAPTIAEFLAELPTFAWPD